jgi:hypothetical protein
VPSALSAALTPSGHPTSLPGRDSSDDCSFPILLHACHGSRLVDLSNVYSMRPFISPPHPSPSIFPHLYFHPPGRDGRGKAHV